MIDIFIEFISAAMTVGPITEANMYSPDFITIDGIATDGRKYGISLRFEKEKKHDADKNP